MADVTVSRTINCSPAEAWVLVADVTRMGEWSPETTGARWLGGADGPHVCARFRGTNKNGLRIWTTVCTVTACRPGEEFTFDVNTGPISTATWSYTFAPRDAGCVVTESWTDRRATWWRHVGAIATGVKDRETHNRASMEATLDALAAHTTAKDT